MLQRWTSCRVRGVLAALLLCALACEDAPAAAPVMPSLTESRNAGAVVALDRRWPSPLAQLSPPQLTGATPERKWRVFIDAGHGAPGNQGTSSCFCEREQDFTLRVAQALGEHLVSTGRFAVKQSRAGAKVPRYPERVDAAERWRADVLLSLHMDARGEPFLWEPTPGRRCWRQDETPGFAILWADNAGPGLSAKRLSLARALAGSLEATGFLPYDGVDYAGLYAADATQAGVFVDRHVPGRRIFLLRKPKVPSVIVETHHALDVREASRWREPRTVQSFSEAVAAALVDFLEPGGGAQATLGGSLGPGSAP